MPSACVSVCQQGRLSELTTIRLLNRRVQQRHHRRTPPVSLANKPPAARTWLENTRCGARAVAQGACSSGLPVCAQLHFGWCPAAFWPVKNQLRTSSVLAIACKTDQKVLLSPISTQHHLSECGAPQSRSLPGKDCTAATTHSKMSSSSVSPRSGNAQRAIAARREAF